VGYLSPLVLPFVVSLAAACLLTPLCRRAALALDIVDRPGGKKIHGVPTPLLGGVGVALAHLVGVWAGGSWDGGSLRILVGGGLVVLLGVCDDRDPHAEGLRWWLRLLLEGCLAVYIVAGGVRTTFLGTPWLDVPLTVLWIVGLTNAFNLLDNMNGLSAGVAAIAGATFALLAARYAELGPEQVPTATAAAALAGACVGFLPSNFRGRIFMGDAGSLFLGFTLAGLAVQGSWRSPTIPTSVIIPLLVLAYPIFDTTLVVILRILRGQSPVIGGKDHSSHRLVRLGLGRVETVLLIYLFAACHAMTALLVSSVTFRLAVSVGVLFIFGMILRKVPAWDQPSLADGARHGEEDG
jgi:UDP-GlcNAc:undecaprenyl-phosphate GlcNAc-1-phosphate transferase